MNLPNKLTVLRVIMIPVFLGLFYLDSIVGFFGASHALPHYLLALIIFAVASLTDMLDGQIARKRGLVTDFGKLMDPLADKLLVMSAMVALISVDMVHPVVVIIILAREFLVTSIRLVAASGGVVIAADGWGKAKTVFQMVWICYGLLLLSLPTQYQIANIIYYALVVIVVALTLISGFNYTWGNRKLFADR